MEDKGGMPASQHPSSSSVTSPSLQFLNLVAQFVGIAIWELITLTNGIEDASNVTISTASNNSAIL